MFEMNLNVIVTVQCGTSKEEFEIPYDEYKEMISKLKHMDRSGKPPKTDLDPLLELKPEIKI